MNRLLVILPLTFATCRVAAQVETQCFEKLYKVSDTLPVLVSSHESILRLLQSRIIIPDSLKSKEGGFGIRYVINCRGNVVGLKKTKVQDSSGNLIQSPFDFLCPQVIEILKNSLKWQPAKSGGHPVDFLQFCSVYFSNGQIIIRLTAT